MVGVIFLGVAGGLVSIWLALVVALSLSKPDDIGLGAAMRLLPDVLRLVKRLAGDRTLPSGVRVRLALLLAYLALPIDLIPDFIPVLGYADDAIIVVLVLRSTARLAGFHRRLRSSSESAVSGSGAPPNQTPEGREK